MAQQHTPNDSKTLAKELLSAFRRAQGKRQPFEKLYSTIATYAGPHWYGWTAKPSHPEPQAIEVLDSKIRKAVRINRAGMLSGVCDPNSPWFGLKFNDPDFQKWSETRRSGQEKAWLQFLERMYFEDLWKAGYYREKANGFGQKALFGWSALYLDESVSGGLRFNTRPLHECYLDRDFNEVVDRFWRSFDMSARNMAEKWAKDALPDEVKKCLGGGASKNEDQDFHIVHAVVPRRDEDRASRSLLRNGMKFASYYILNQGEGQIISEGGYEEMPYIVTRDYQIPGSPYSYSAGSEVLADVQMLNEMKRCLLESAQLAGAPPYLVPDDGFVSRFSMKPRAINYYRKDSNTTAADFKPLEVGGDPRFSFELYTDVGNDIDDAFHVQLFQSMQARIATGSTPTAREVIELAKERMWLLTPALVNEQVESMEPMFDRLYAIKSRRGEVPPPPFEAEGQEFAPVYKSPLMSAQQEYRVRNILSTYEQAAQIAQLSGDMGVFDNFDHMQATRIIADQRGLPQEVLRGLEDVLGGMKAKAQAAAQMQGMAGVQQALGQYQGLAKAPEQGSPAEMVMRSLTGGVQ